MELLENISERIYSENDHTIYLAKWSSLKLIVRRWSGNREPDMTRVKEIKERIDEGKYVFIFLHLAFVEKEGLVCYDGYHRLEALCRCKNIKDKKILVDVLFKEDEKLVEQEIRECFKGVNKSIHVPEMYINNEDLEVKEEIRNVVVEFENKLNKQYSEGIYPIAMKEKAMNKCRKYGFWIFRERSISREHMKNVINKLLE